MSDESRRLGPRKRDAVATRAAILQSARVSFTRSGYDQTGVRDIAAEAGVDPALVIRYFGGKERLFAEAVGQKFELPEVLEGDRATLGVRLARYVVDKDVAEKRDDPILALLRASGNERANALLRDAIDRKFVRPLADVLGGDQAMLRAGAIASFLLGLSIGRYVIRSEALATDDVEALVAVVAPVLQAYVDGEVASP